MVKDEILLRLEMGRLEIEPAKPKENKYKENPFIPLYPARSIFRKKSTHKCSCSYRRNATNIGVSKKKSNKILKDPLLKILKFKNGSIQSDSYCENSTINDTQVGMHKSICSDTLSLCALVHNCNQLKISSGTKGDSLKIIRAKNNVHWWRNDISKTKADNESNLRNQRSSCSQQALNPPCDVTIDELASYFETLVHIPKKMSSMAEMMYI